MAFSIGKASSSGLIPALGDLISMATLMAPAASSVVSAGTTDTVSAAQLLSGIVVRSGVATAVTATTDTATNIVAAMGANVFVGQTFLLFYANNNTGTGVVTFVAGAGVTTVGILTVPIAGLRVIQGSVTNITTGSNAVVLNSLFSIGAGVAA